MALRRLPVTNTDYHPAYVVWELTLRCDQACRHCGSRAGRGRADELSRAQALAVVAQLAELRAREVVLIGGEAYLHPAFLDVVRALKQAGVRPVMTTGGRGVTPALARAMAAAGLYAASVSIDGTRAAHDTIRNRAGSYKSAIAALGHLRAAGIRTAANTNINRVNAPALEALYEVLREAGVYAWQVQITAPLGRAADHPEMLLQPWDLLDVVPRLAALKRRGFDDGVRVMPGNNLGYFGPEEVLLRSLGPGGHDHFQGCQAGRRVLGIESDGGVKGCPSLQSSDYVGGNVREQPLAEIWQQAPALGFTRARSRADLWGFCAECPFADTCLAGCTFTAHATLGRPGNNPYCHFRAQHFARRGLRERLVPAEPAPGRPFDNGRFDVVVEPMSTQPSMSETQRHPGRRLRRLPVVA
ncbi:MAG: GDL motif peptide-associated radical SAM/SPASM maturase [Haliangiales bacterium]